MRSKDLQVFLFLILFLAGAHSELGLVLYPTNNKTITFYNCLHSAGYQRATYYIQHTTGGYANYTMIKDNLNNMRNAGFMVDIALGFCRAADVYYQIQTFFNNIPKNMYFRIWIYTLTMGDDKKTDCHWNHYDIYSSQSSCRYLQFLLKAFKQNGVQVGVASLPEVWQNMFKDKCQFSDYDLFWIPLKTFVNKPAPTFDDFEPFGGWTTPKQKYFEFLGPNICGAIQSRSYFQSLFDTI